MSVSLGIASKYAATTMRSHAGLFNSPGFNLPMAPTTTQYWDVVGGKERNANLLDIVDSAMSVGDGQRDAFRAMLTF